MVLYLVKNTDDYPVVLEFCDGKNVRLRPNGSFIWQGPAEDFDRMLELIADGVITVLRLDLAGYEETTRSEVASDWVQEGF